MRYEYKVVKVATTTAIATIETALNNQGNLGWELMNIILQGTDLVFYLKRRVAR